MNRPTLFALLLGAALGLPAVSGCEDKTISEEKKVDVDDGKVTTETDRLKKTSDGVVRETSKKVENAADDAADEVDRKKIDVDVDD